MKTIIAVSAIGLLWLSTGSHLLACGEKYIVASRGTRFDRPPSPRQPATILLYANPNSELSRRLATLSVGDALRTAGYRPTIASDTREFMAALSREHWDVVLLDVADMPTVAGGIGERALPSVVPVTYTTSGPAWNQTKRQYPAVVKAPDKARAFIDVIDKTLERRQWESGPASKRQP